MTDARCCEVSCRAVLTSDGVCPVCDPEDMARCPACGEPIDYCQGHGEIGDPRGALALDMHDDGDHSLCVVDCDGEV